VEIDRELDAQRLRHELERLARSDRGRAEHEIGRRAAYGEMAADALRRVATARGERSIAIREARAACARLCVPEQPERLHICPRGLRNDSSRRCLLEHRGSARKAQSACGMIPPALVNEKDRPFVA